jgi:hypothetical protein
MDIQLGRPRSTRGTAYPFLGRSPFLGQSYSRKPSAVVHTTVAPKAKQLGAAQHLRTSKDLGTDTVAVDSGRALARIAESHLIHNLLEPIVCWAFQGTIDSKEIGWDLCPFRLRLSDHIPGRNLCNPPRTPSLCAIAQNIRIPHCKFISTSRVQN